jgi:hypothetical protein
MRKLNLKDFEHNISDATWNTALDIEAESGVKSLQEVEKNFWVARVEHFEQPFETEVILSSKTVKAYTCECWTEGRQLICPHIAASLLKIRQYLAKKAEDKLQKQLEIPEPEGVRISINTILANITQADLSDFVKNYFRQDKDFALSLKTFYVGLQGESETHFQHLLEAVLPKKSKTLVVFAEPQMKRLIKMLSDFIEHIKETENHRLVYQISGSTLTKILPIIDHFTLQQLDKILPFCELALKAACYSAEAAPSPELKEDFWIMLFNLAEKEAYPKELQRMVIAFLAKKCNDSEKNTQIEGLFFQKPNPVSLFIATLYIAALAQNGIKKGGIRILEDQEFAINQICDCIQQLFYLDYHDACIEMIEHFMSNKTFTVALLNEFENIYIEIAEKKGDKLLLKKAYRQHFFSIGNFDYFYKLKELSGNKWEKDLQKIVKEATEKEKYVLVANILLEEEEYTLLEIFLKHRSDLNLLKVLEQNLLKLNKDFLQDQYVQLLGDYLEKHFGLPAAVYLKKILGGLALKREYLMLENIINSLCKQYPERDTLREELADLFPKTYKTK